MISAVRQSKVSWKVRKTA